MFIQAHLLTSYAAALLNRDDSGAAKRIVFGGKPRVRISSQCLKRAWRESIMAMEDERFPTAVRSTALFEKLVLPGVIAAGIPEARAREGLRFFIEKILKGSGDKKNATSLETNQPLMLGQREIAFLIKTFAATLSQAGNAKELVEPFVKGSGKKTVTALLGLDDSVAYGVETALFGRFVTSDVLARTDAAVSVAHAQTVHEAAVELDFFSVVDDLGLTTGADHIGEAELSAGLFYQYLSIDVAGLVANLTGCTAKDWRAQDLTVSGELVKTLLSVAATKSPGAKKGSTAPYAVSDFVLLEVGTEQPRQLANSFLKPVYAGDASLMDKSIGCLGTHMGQLDEMYGIGTKRFFVSTAQDAAVPGAVRSASLAEALKNALSAAGV